MDIELFRAVAKGEAEARDPDLAEFAAWISQPRLDRDQMLLLMEALAAEPFDAGADLPRSRRCSSREPRTILPTSWQRPFRTRNTCRCPVIIAAR